MIIHSIFEKIYPIDPPGEAKPFGLFQNEPDDAWKLKR